MAVLKDMELDIRDYLDSVAAKGPPVRGPRLRWVERQVVKRFAVTREVAREEIELWLTEVAR